MSPCLHHFPHRSCRASPPALGLLLALFPRGTHFRAEGTAEKSTKTLPPLGHAPEPALLNDPTSDQVTWEHRASLISHSFRAPASSRAACEGVASLQRSK